MSSLDRRRIQASLQASPIGSPPLATDARKEDGMYGTIARLKVKPDRVEALQQMTASYDDLEVPGFVGTHVYRMDADDTEYYLVVLFEDRESYRKNAEDPAQDRRYREMRELLAEDPEWHDGEVVWSSTR